MYQLTNECDSIYKITLEVKITCINCRFVELFVEKGDLSPQKGRGISYHHRIFTTLVLKAATFVCLRVCLSVKHELCKSHFFASSVLICHNI